MIDMACPMEANKTEKKAEKIIRKYQQLCFEIHERRSLYMVKVVPTVIGCLGGGIKKLREDLSELFKEEEMIVMITREMQKMVL